MWAKLLAVAMVALCAGCGSLPFIPRSAPSGPPVGTGSGGVAARHVFGVFVGSDEMGVRRLAEWEQFLGTRLRLGHTYLPGNNWDDVRGSPEILEPWARWRAARPDALFVLNIPMATPNEAPEELAKTGLQVLTDDQVSALLGRAAEGEFDEVYRTLASRLVGHGLADAVIVPGWEMNGVTYSHRCAPNPRAWQQFFRRIVSAMRSVPGQRFSFDFTPSRGTDAVSWKECYPGDDVVDIVGMDSYDQPPGESWDDYVTQPDGLQEQVDFAAAHGKPVSYPEWGLFRNGDNPEFIRDMSTWMARQDTVYSTFTDYCPHGVLTDPECSNPLSAAAVQEQFGGR